MFAAKSAILFALLAISTHVAVAAPPACLLGAVNTQPKPGDLNAICGDNASKVQSTITSMCGSNTDDALKAFASSCAAAGKTVPSASASNSTSKSATITGSVTASASPYIRANSTIIYNSTFYDSSCSCTKTTAISTMATVMASARPSGGVAGSGATGTPIAPSATSGSTTQPSAPINSGAASTARTGSFAALFVGVAGLAMAL